MPNPDVTPYDALLLVSFGGPEGPDDVVPFLENVTRGRGIPRERLEEVGKHYSIFGGRSPINDLNRDLLASLRADLAEAGIDLPVYWGNRNWDPYLRDTLAQMAADGVTRAACFMTSAYSSWSSCRQYRENLYDAVEGQPGAPVLDKLRHYFNHPGFVGPVVDATLAALADLPDDVRRGAHLAFVTHSVPTAMNDTSGPDGGAYVEQHLSVSTEVARQVGEETGIEHPWELVYCSRSGSPHAPWLEPDVNDHLEALHGAGAQAVVMVPLGFVSDHMEVVYDLDTEAQATAERLGLPARRAATAGTDPRFVAMVRDLLLERATVERGEDVVRASVGSLGALWDRCPVGCCANPKGERPALCGEQ
ncbi:putative ferrochelatase [Nocardioides szechwanensis]|uniref:Coproporphyrin III ferrochelatase n=1 Tax=Nocardioides szechwanensis TaxID=1005944 RepID=A0A1G9VYK4_9ACTN|nr:ferrochelatase [Nocardioides szechwanensis]GEP32797.1 putative ferrochelatase [Nocardioides szechwanensis]SDM77320.1 ferrochelatase [Nocardioides szechwanensis]